MLFARERPEHLDRETLVLKGFPLRFQAIFDMMLRAGRVLYTRPARLATPHFAGGKARHDSPDCITGLPHGSIVSGKEHSDRRGGFAEDRHL